MSKDMAPPKLPFRILRWFCKPFYQETIEGDLRELYERQYGDKPAKARWRLYMNVLRFFRWRYIKDLEDFQPKSSIGMFKTYFKVSFRSLNRHKVHSLLNIFGLTVGIAGCLLILMHVTHQLKYDSHIADVDRIYRVVKDHKGRYTPARLVSQMMQDYPEIESGTRVSGPFESIVRQGNRFIKLEGGIAADSTFFEVFPNRFLRGDHSKALNEPNTLVLTASLAERLFENKNPVGQILNLDESDYTITAVVADPPRTSTIPYKFIASMPRAFWATTGWWTGNNFFSYLKLKPHVDHRSLEAKFPDFVQRYIGPEILQFSTQYETFEDFLADGNSHSFQLVPMKDIHLHYPALSLGKPGNYQNMVVFAMIAAFILVIACVNYINMSTARSSLRAKEIGMRKVMGSVKRMIAWQFIVESFIIAFISLLTGIVLAIVVLPVFNRISDNQYLFTDLLNIQNVGWFVLILLIVGFLSGSYPALYLSSFKPITALRGEASSGGNKKMRSALVILQFTLAIFLMAATLIVYKQVQLMSERNLGLSANQVFVIKRADKVADQYAAFRNELLAGNDVLNTGVANAYPSTFLSDWIYQTQEDNPRSIAPYNIFVTSEIHDVWGLELISGRFFNSELDTDTATIVVNEQLVKELGWKDPLGKVLTRSGNESYRVIGVVKDFVTGSAKRENYPLLFRYYDAQRVVEASGGGTYIVVKVTGNYQEAIEHMESTWEKFATDYPFEGIFMDDSFERLYDSERRFGLLFTGFSSLAIIIGCIGLFALVSFTLERKRKEIALRKVLGAEVLQVMVLVFKGFGKLLCVSAFIALPLVFYLGNHWLEEYVYRIEINGVMLVLPVLLVFFMALLTVSYQTYRTAASNPVEALKEE